MTATGKLVTVFGGSGFLGRHIVRALVQDGWRVRAAVRHPNTAHFLRPMGRVGQIQIVKADILKDDDVAAAVEGADAVINLVGSFKNMRGLHVGGARRVAEASARAGVEHLVQTSVVGASADAPATYFQTKAEGEEKVREAFAGATIIRPSLVFGPEDDFFNRFAALIRLVPVVFPLFANGVTRFQPVFVGDIARAVAAIVQAPATAGKTFELAGPEIMTFREVIEYVLLQTRRSRLLINVPLWLAKIKGAFLQILPNAPLTLDQARMLQTDTVASGELPGLRELGITPTGAEAIVPSYLWRFRKRGQFEAATQ
jgi:uncharacterized protein YbjT (DUF2867 family)